MHEDNCAVYVHVNLINGKRYFGITTQKLNRRWQNGYGYYRNAHFMNAIKKYGWDNFGHYILYRDIPIKIAKNIEELLIREYMSYDPRFGYNKTMGGELEIPTEETRRKLSKNNPAKRPEVAAKISEGRKEYFKNHPEAREALIGHEVSKETRDAISKAMSKAVEALDPESGRRVLFFKSAMDAERAGFDEGHISKCCNGKRKTHRGYCWAFVKGGDKDDGDN